MRVVCPSCHAAYDVPDRLLGGGPRRLHCNRCGHEWTLDTAQALAEAAEAAMRQIVVATQARPQAERPIPVRLRPQGPERRPNFAPHDAVRGGRASTLVGWVVTLGILGVLSYAAYVRRDEVMTAWPASERVYMALGLR